MSGSALLAKADIISAFCLLLLHPSAFNSLAFQFQGEFYFDRCLSMGCSLSCQYFKLFPSFVEWVVSCRTGSDTLLHYFDDFLFIGKADSDECLYHFTEFRIVCREFGIPLTHEKSVYPTSCLEFLGIQIDTIAMEFWLPLEKIVRIQKLLVFVMTKTKVHLKILQSLLGLLQFASRIMPIGRILSETHLSCYFWFVFTFSLCENYE